MVRDVLVPMPALDERVGEVDAVDLEVGRSGSRIFASDRVTGHDLSVAAEPGQDPDRHVGQGDRSDRGHRRLAHGFVREVCVDAGGGAAPAVVVEGVPPTVHVRPGLVEGHGHVPPLPLENRLLRLVGDGRLPDESRLRGLARSTNRRLGSGVVGGVEHDQRRGCGAGRLVRVLVAHRTAVVDVVDVRRPCRRGGLSEEDGHHGNQTDEDAGHGVKSTPTVTGPRAAARP